MVTALDEYEHCFDELASIYITTVMVYWCSLAYYQPGCIARHLCLVFILSKPIITFESWGSALPKSYNITRHYRGSLLAYVSFHATRNFGYRVYCPTYPSPFFLSSQEGWGHPWFAGSVNVGYLITSVMSNIIVVSCLPTLHLKLNFTRCSSPGWLIVLKQDELLSFLRRKAIPSQVFVVNSAAVGESGNYVRTWTAPSWNYLTTKHENTIVLSEIRNAIIILWR